MRRASTAKVCMCMHAEQTRFIISPLHPDSIGLESSQFCLPAADKETAPQKFVPARRGKRKNRRLVLPNSTRDEDSTLSMAVPNA